MASLDPKPCSSLVFSPSSATESGLFAPRIGLVSLKRPAGSAPLVIPTPAMMTATSRGIVPHLSQDNVRLTNAIRWVHVPFESFLEQIPPVPTLPSGPHPLHQFLGYSPNDHIASMSARDPFDGREMPANSKDYISAYCIRGVRKVTPQAWATYDAACNPDIVTALSDIPFTPAPHSQKRTTKSLERSTTWLVDLLKSTVARRKAASADQNRPELTELSNVLVHMAGGAIAQARKAFAEALVEDLDSRDAERLRPLRRLDDGVAGYVFDLVPLRVALCAQVEAATGEVLESQQARGAMNTLGPAPTERLPEPSALGELLQASLRPLSRFKPRIVNSARSPHEMLRLIRDVGVDVFDAHWAQRAADIGVALDFRFPIVLPLPASASLDSVCASPTTRASGKTDLGHNLYNSQYACDHSRLAACFLDEQSFAQRGKEGLPNLTPACPCGACSPRGPSTHILHSSVDRMSWADNTGALEPPFTRSYVHHLLHTHEMSAHSLLVMHNLSVLDAFFSGVRTVLAGPDAEGFFLDVERFLETYDEEMVIFDEARVDWAQVEQARGKGRLAREKVKQAESSLGTSVEL